MHMCVWSVCVIFYMYVCVWSIFVCGVCLCVGGVGGWVGGMFISVFVMIFHRACEKY